jgi:predicted metal-binding protein
MTVKAAVVRKMACPSCRGTGVDRMQAIEVERSHRPRSAETRATIRCGTCAGKGWVAV